MVLFKRNQCEIWFGPGTVICWEHKQVLVKHGGTYVRVHPSRLRLYPGNEENCLNGNQEQNTHNPSLSQQKCDETLVQSDSEDKDADFEPSEQVEAEEQISNDVELEQHDVSIRSRGRPSRLKSVPKIVALPTPAQIIKCKLVNDDSEWREFNIISKAGKATGKNKYLINVVMEEGEPFWLDFEHGVTE